MEEDWESCRTATIATDIKDDEMVAYAIFWSECDSDHPVNFGSTTVNKQNGKSAEYEGIRIAIQQAAENGYSHVKICLINKDTIAFLTERMNNWKSGSTLAADDSSTIFETLRHIDQYWTKIQVKFEAADEEAREYQDALQFAKEL